MSSADLLADGFPHGTPTGYDLGCKAGGMCPNKGSDQQTCKEAKIRYNSDAAYRRELDATPKPSNFETFKKPAAAREISDELRAKLAAPDFPHGTTRGYSRGCKKYVQHLCTGDTDGRTCAQAWSDYLAERSRIRATQDALVEAGVPAADLDKATTNTLALADAGLVDEALDATDAATVWPPDGLEPVAFADLDLDRVSLAFDFDPSNYAESDAPDIAVDGLVAELDDTRHRLQSAQSQISTLEKENDQLTALTKAQRSEIETLRAQLTTYVNTGTLPASPGDIVHLELNAHQAANVILALAGGDR